jgi:lipopolysaccharide/colanic/teichoic acid biosynthesis glycosyltransferase
VHCDAVDVAPLKPNNPGNRDMAITASVGRGDFVSVWHERRAALLDTGGAPAERRVRGEENALRVGDDVQLSVKRALDVAGAACALVFLAPLLIAIAVAIKATSSGPVMFRQYRYGYRNKRFLIYKFRTMHTHLADLGGTKQTTRHDPRITSIGRLLRSTSLDELPQLLNVLRGDMSLVGPRPHVPGMFAGGMLYEELVPYYFQRHTVRPGITGLAQVNGCRGETVQAHDAIARIDYDLEYIEKWSPWIDVKIIAKTCRREFLSGHGT